MLLLFLLQALFVTLVVGQVTIDIPSSLTQCETTTLTWTGGSAPYSVYIYPEFYLDVSSFYERLGPVDGTSITYNVNVPAGKKIRINVRDSANPEFDGSAFSDVIEIGTGADDACLAAGPIGTGGIPQLPSDTGIPSGFGNFSAPSIAPFPDTATSGGSSTSSTGFSITSSPASTSSSSSGIASATSTGLRSGDGPVSGDAPNSGFVLGNPPVLVFTGLIAFMGVLSLL